MNFLFGSNKAFFGIIIVASVVIALMMVIAKGVVTYGLELMLRCSTLLRELSILS